MRWLRRTDDARRTKGDPPPTYLQLAAKVADLEEARLALLQQCELLDERNARLRAQNKELRESNLRLLNDANQMRQRLPRVAAGAEPAEEPAAPVYDVSPEDRAMIARMTGGVFGGTEVVPDYGVPATEDPTVLEHDPWKDETR